jgi:F-type H+-transporting ATPase subunit epsilon
VRLSVTTPRGSLVEADVEEVTAPGVLGEFGILPTHVPFLSGIRPGVLLYRAKDATRVFAVGSGVLEVARSGGGEKVLVLVDQAATAEEVDKTAAAKELAEADAELARWNKDLGGEYQALLIRRAWASARVDAAARLGGNAGA